MKKLLTPVLLAGFALAGIAQSGGGLSNPFGVGHTPVVNTNIQPGNEQGAAGVTVKANGTSTVHYSYCNGVVNGERTHQGHHFVDGDNALVTLTSDNTKITAGGDGNTVNYSGSGITGTDVHVGGTNGTVNMNGNSQVTNSVSTSPSGTINP